MGGLLIILGLRATAYIPRQYCASAVSDRVSIQCCGEQEIIVSLKTDAEHHVSSRIDWAGNPKNYAMPNCVTHWRSRVFDVGPSIREWSEKK